MAGRPGDEVAWICSDHTRIDTSNNDNGSGPRERRAAERELLSDTGFLDEVYWPNGERYRRPASINDR